jgi:thiol-disulfide isomerase/thioredoxin
MITALKNKVIRALRIILVIACFLLHLSLCETVENQDTQSAGHENKDFHGTVSTSHEDRKQVEAIQLTTRNFRWHLSDGSIWLIELYSHECGHCVEFAPVYAEIARHYHDKTLHASRSRSVKVGKIDGNAERVLLRRFHVNSYPSIFIVDGYKAYEFKGKRAKEILIRYVDGGYKADAPISMYESPMGPIGLLIGMIMTLCYAGEALFIWIQDTFGFSPIFTSMVLFGSVFLGSFFCIVFLTFLVPHKIKEH